MQLTRITRVASLAAIVAVAIGAGPAPALAQTIKIGGLDMGGIFSRPSGPVGLDSRGKPSVPPSADSLKALRAFVNKKQPVIVIDGMVSTSKAFLALQLDTIVSVAFQEGDAEVKHYGKKAENGVLIIKTGKRPPAPVNKDAKSQTPKETKPQSSNVEVNMGGISGQAVIQTESGSTNTEPAKTKTQPAKTEPAKTEPAKTEPAKTEKAPEKTDKK